jgi:hypothetical protein
MLFSEDVRQAAMEVYEQKIKIDEAMEKTFRRFMETVEPFDINDPQLWNTIGALVKCIHYDDTKRNLHNFFCHIYRSEKISMIDALRMIKTQGVIKDRLYDPMYELVCRGDDGYGDLLDSMFLSGPRVVKACLNKDLLNEKDLQRLMIEEVGEKLANHILNGENYYSMTMEEVARDRINWLKAEPKEQQVELELEDDSDKPWYERGF